MAEKMLKLGKAFKELRHIAGTTGRDLKSVLSRVSLVNFEAGKSVLGLEKLEAALELMGFTMTDLFYMANVYHVEPLYGNTFHSIRWQRGYRRDFFLPIGVSQMRLDLFEAGRIMFHYNTIDAMLNRMRVPEGDFEYALTNQENYFIEAIDALDRAMRVKDIDYITKIEDEAHDVAKNEIKELPHAQEEERNLDKEPYSSEELLSYSEEQLTPQYADYRVLELTAKSGRKLLSEEEIIEIGDFLMGVGLWMEYSLGLLAINARQLPFVTLHGILEDLLVDRERYMGKLAYRRRVVQIGERGAINQMRKGELEHAELLLDMVRSFDTTIDTHTQATYRFVQGMLKWKKGDENGRKEMEKAIDIVDFLGEPESRDFLQDLYANV